MICEKIRPKISFLPRGELSFDERKIIHDHLEVCSQCNTEYQEYLRMFYLIDKTSTTYVPDQIIENFSESVISKVKSNNNMNFKINRIVWYAAAAVIVFFLFIYNFSAFQKYNNSVSNLNTISITDMVHNEEWYLLLKKIEKNELNEEYISVSLLLAKLDNLDNTLANNVIKEKLGKTNKEFRDLLRLLNNYQRYKSRISVKEISKYLNS